MHHENFPPLERQTSADTVHTIHEARRESAVREGRDSTIDVIPPHINQNAPIEGERISSFDFFTDANIQIDDMENLEQSLAYVNPYRRKYQDDHGVEMNIQVFEDSGKQGIRQVTIRTVLDEISASTFLWERGKMADKKKSWRNLTNHPKLRASKDEYERYSDTDTSTRDGCGVGAIRMRIRDLRILDFSINPNSAYSIVVRRHAVLISLDPIRAVVMANQVIIMLPPGGMDNIIGILGGFMDSWSDGGLTALNQRDLALSSPSSSRPKGGSIDDNNQEELGNTPTYFEMHVYEAIFTTINTLHAQQYKLLNDEAAVVLSYFNQQTAVIVPLLIQERFRSLKNGLTDLLTRLASYRRAFITVIDDDESMALMNLTILKETPAFYNVPLRPEILACHDEIEELLESYLMETNTLQVKVNNLKTNLDNAEELLLLRLDMSQNRILGQEMVLLTCMCFVGFGAYIAGLFGMNLDNTITIQPVYGVFEVVFVVTFALIVFGSYGVNKYWEYIGVIPVELKYHRRK